ncbi:response regulator [Chitinophaga rhizosphaerae]|uniref:response regulator n=1 Tax=Chitinophaga rhizosphaerae TaxID=1864947 RepID=UPI000F80782A|nr:response regulator [Chitinophaga rhizosphaerae]
MVRKALNILIVDDDQDDKDFITDTILKQAPNANVQGLESGAEALDYFSIVSPMNFPDLIILDYNMPRMNGLETLDKIASVEMIRSIPIAVVSTANERIYRRECLAHGAIRYFEKPSDMAHWGHIVEELLELVSPVL